MFRFRNLLGLSLISLVSSGFYFYHSDNSFRSVCNLVYAGANMAYIYKITDGTTLQKNTNASGYLRDALKKNGGIYLKLGQLIATLDVIVPDEYRHVMSTLTRQCEVAPFSQVKTTIQEDMGFPVQVIFKNIDQKPVSSASIGQVHKAQLLNGQNVAVKIQHRHLMDHVGKDLQMMRIFVEIALRLFPQFSYKWLVQQFQKNIKLQLNFVHEAANMKRTQRFLKQNDFKDIYVPKIYLKPTQRVLVMEYIDGVHIDQVDKLKQMGVNTKEISKLFSNMIIKMIHKQGFVHADTHSGNLMVRKLKNKKDQLVLLDHGLYQQLDHELIKNYNEFWLGLILNDPKHYETAARKLGTTNPKLLLLMLTSKTDDQFNDKKRNIFDLNPSTNKSQIMKEAAQNHEKIIKVLNQLKRQILLLLKVNQFARTIENMMSGRQMGVYEDIARQCVDNLGYSFVSKCRLKVRMLASHSKWLKFLS